MNGPVTKYLTVEGICAVLGGTWFIVSSLLPAIPALIPLGFSLPLVGDAITPGLLIAVAFLPIVVKDLIPGMKPFVNTNAPKEAP